MKEKVVEILKKTFGDVAKKEGWAIACPLFEVERPRLREHGEFASNLALLLARGVKRKPPEIASLLLKHLQDPDHLIEKGEVAGGGFLNFVLKPQAWQNSLAEISASLSTYGRSDIGKGKKVVVEFVSANPTGPLHIGNARGGPLGDVMASLLEWTGHEVARHYYVNDVGGQIEKLGESLEMDLRGETSGEGERHYTGSYIHEMALEAKKKFKKTEWDKRLLGEFGVDSLFREIQKDCEAMGIHFDAFVHEKEILDSGETGRVLTLLKEKGATLTREGALWFVPEGKGQEALEDRESVLVRSDGRPTYFANDIAYHVRKYREGFDRLINIWGSNHHGHVPRICGAVKKLGYDPGRIETVLYQYVRVKRGNDVVKMSKRAGNYVTAREVLDEVGRDAFRFFLLMRAAASHLDFDLELAKRQSQDNPVYYVQYAHARLASIFRKGAEQNLTLPKKPRVEKLTLPEEIEMISLLHQFPEEVRLAAERLEPHRIPFYLLTLTQSFQAYYSKAKEDPRYRVLPVQVLPSPENTEKISAPKSSRKAAGGPAAASEVDTSGAKLYLCHILKETIRRGLELLGVSQPELMVSS